MKTLVRSGKNEKSIKVLKKEGSFINLAFGDNEYGLDVEKVEEGVYSIIYNDRCINMEVIETGNTGNYKVNTLYAKYNIEVSSASNAGTTGGKKHGASQRLTSPMSGKIIKINAQLNDMVDEGASLLIISAMKMENEFKSSGHGVVTRIDVKEGDVVREGQLLMEITTKS